MIISQNSGILTPREELIYQHKWYLPPQIRQKLNYHFMKVWSAKYLASQIDANGFLYHDSILYKCNSKYRPSELFTSLNESGQIGISFRCLTGNSGYAILKPWSINSQAATDSFTGEGY